MSPEELPEEVTTLEEKIEARINPQIISESELSRHARCGYMHMINKHIGASKAPKSAYAHMALFFEIQRKKLLDIKDRDVGNLFVRQRLVGPHLKPAEQMNSEELQAHLAFMSPEAFGAAMNNRWRLATENGQYAGVQINWDHTGQDWSSARRIEQACTNYYKFVLENGAPISGLINEALVLEFDGKNYRVKIPEVRVKDGKVYIDDPTLWGFSAEIPDSNSEEHKTKKANIRSSRLVTMKIATLDQYVRNCELIRLKLGIREVPQDLSYIVYRHFNATKDEKSATYRRPEDIEILRETLNGFDARQENFEPDRSYCPSCPYNTVIHSGEILCRQRTPNIKPSVPAAYFLKKNLVYEMQEQAELVKMKGFVVDGRRRSPILEMDLKLNQTQDAILAHTIYSSEVRGHGHEKWSMGEAIKKIREIRKSRKLEVIHTVDLERDYPRTGKQLMAQFLSKKKYTLTGGIYQKTY